MTSDISTIKAIIIFDTTSKLLYANYTEDIGKYLKNLTDFQNGVMNRIISKGIPSESSDDAFLYGPFVIVYQKVNDVFFSLSCISDENEAIASAELSVIVQSLQDNLDGDLSAANILYRYNEVLLAIDAAIDNGIIFDDDARSISQRSYVEHESSGTIAEILGNDTAAAVQQTATKAFNAVKKTIFSFFQ
ncbi:Coatomer subunit zeta (CopZ) [Monocercomonoides exilis]|uniref:Coatomer subunit zeta (CopZ) n=1 Tax=Monocercomonoides exilis TaxID=2049356 RepID=UPI00355A5375|nr:Coatomer subunit zeta (CopZ) [Monocercomonoides exilis]|eukprot:MONOS_16781.1-p1 / transcript=MONOS_16781.1 / gene=MONOS_16781 / organism=Monocercomonoides_exilis_PA203 / gene_product=Coatomer subunit zeta (CopZ) / transcript_product=Coatomer subunit zeta (CopZ) / location=Mono_scaffold00025:4034-4870(+) / protein_length=190 / sequence_SO=supercontig / SO=protein_coding / is_pseudo=false